MKKKCIIGRLFLLLISVSFSGCGGGSDALSMSPRPHPAGELRILVIGQSISSNCNERIYGPADGVYQIGLGGEIKAAKDPFEWADCSRGSMWMPLGKKLIESGIASKVVFMPIGVDSSRAQDWQPGGRAFGKLTGAIDLINREQIRFDFALWHQGSADFGLAPSEYSSRLASVVDYVNARITVGRWLIALHSRCFGRYDMNIEMAQRAFGNAPQLGRHIGPNNNSLGDEYRVDTCHLNAKGQEEMALLWLDSIRNVINNK